MEDDQSLDEVNATFRVKDQQEKEKEYHVPLVKESLSSKREEAVVAKAEKLIVSTHELLAPYGCRSVATKGGHFRARANLKCPVCGIQFTPNLDLDCAVHLNDPSHRHAVEFP